MSSKRLLFIILILAVILSLSLALTACNTEELSVVFMISDSDVYTTVSVIKAPRLAVCRHSLNAQAMILAAGISTTVHGRSLSAAIQRLWRALPYMRIG